MKKKSFLMQYQKPNDGSALAFSNYVADKVNMWAIQCQFHKAETEKKSRLMSRFGIKQYICIYPDGESLAGLHDSHEHQ